MSESTTYSPDCFTFIEQQISQIRGGARPYPIFFTGDKCSRKYKAKKGGNYEAYWPRTNLSANMYNRDISSFLCNGSYDRNCPIPEIKSLILPPNVRLKFTANKHRLRSMRTSKLAENANSLHSIQELGQVHLYADPPSNLIGDNGDSNTQLFEGMNIIEDLEKNKLIWYSSGDTFVSKSEDTDLEEHGNGFVVIGELNSDDFKKSIPIDWESRNVDLKKTHVVAPGEYNGMISLHIKDTQSNCIFPTLYEQVDLISTTHTSTEVSEKTNRKEKVGHGQVTYGRLPGRPGQIGYNSTQKGMKYQMSKSLFGTNKTENNRSQYQGMMASLLSCGSPFFPSFKGLRSTWRHEIETYRKKSNETVTDGIYWLNYQPNQANHEKNNGINAWPKPGGTSTRSSDAYDKVFADPLCTTRTNLDKVGSWNIEKYNWKTMATDALVQTGFQMRNTQVLLKDITEDPDIKKLEKLDAYKNFNPEYWQSYRFHSTSVIAPPYRNSTKSGTETVNVGLDAYTMKWTDTNNSSLSDRPVGNLMKDIFPISSNVNRSYVETMPCTRLRVDHKNFNNGPRGPNFIAGVNLNKSSQQSDLHIVDGSVGSLKIEFVDDEHNLVTWQDVQRLWCMKSVRGEPVPTFGGVPILGYEQGSLLCDDIMRDVCSNSATIVNDPIMIEACGCIQEMNRIMRDKTDNVVPLHCMSAKCQGFNTGVYNPNSTEQNCTTNICNQTVRSNSYNTSMQTSQVMACNTVANSSTPTILNTEDSYVNTKTDFSAVITYSALIIVFVISLIILICILKYVLF